MDIALGKKLNYLSETKDLIKAALIEKGQAVSDTDTFRSYAGKVLAIETGGGSIEGVHYVTFMSQDGTTELYKRIVADGDDCADPVVRGYISAPTKESTVQYDYAFVGWATTPNGAWDSNALKAVTEDKTVYAAFASALRYYTITYYDDDGTTVLKTESLAYGSMPSYVPSKGVYVFTGWTPELTAVTGDASYTASWADTVASGTFESGATWSLSGSGVLSISGVGAMDDYSAASGQPWYANYRLNIKSIVVGSGITKIGKYAFASLTAVTGVAISNSVKEIGDYAFYGMQLTSITLSTGLSSIGLRAIAYNNKLTELIIPTTAVCKIGNAAFERCDVLANVTIGSGVNSIGLNAFLSCPKLASVIFEDTSDWYTGFSAGSTATKVDVTDPVKIAETIRKSPGVYFTKI